MPHYCVSMINFYLAQAFNLLIVIVAIIGLIRYRFIDSAFKPFLVLMWCGAINEIINVIIIDYFGGYNILNSNLYYLLESLLLLWQFKSWKMLRQPKFLYHVLITSFILFWAIETILVTKLYHTFNSYFIVFYSLISILLFINMFNRNLVMDRKSVFKNPIFIICFGSIMILTYSLLRELCFLYNISFPENGWNVMHSIFLFINLFCNTIFGLAILWMPKRQAFTLQY